MAIILINTDNFRTDINQTNQHIIRLYQINKVSYLKCRGSLILFYNLR